MWQVGWQIAWEVLQPELELALQPMPNELDLCMYRMLSKIAIINMEFAHCDDEYAIDIALTDFRID